jgi:prepilin-type N-terminal cleavage/methylation domain-containing protein
MANKKKGFTLIEMLIVIAIVGILASLVLVGLGPVQKRGRDARRISDLRQIQNGLELYFSAKGGYPVEPSPVDMTKLGTTLAGAGIGVNSIPHDPNWREGATTGDYKYGSDGVTYRLGAVLEDGSNPVLTNSVKDSLFSVECNASSTYCVSL